MRVLFRSHNLIGDALNISPALRTWIKNDPDKSKHIYMQTLPDHVAPLYIGMVRDLLGEHCATFRTVFNREDVPTPIDFEHVFDVNKAFEVSDKDKCHIAESYAKLLGVQLEKSIEEGHRYDHLKLTYIPDDNKWMEGPHQPLGSLRDCILVSMFSASCTSHDPKCNFVPNKQLPFEKWKPILTLLKEHYPDTPFKFLGAPTDVVPDILKEFGEPMFGIPLNRLALIMQKAKLLVTIDNGMSHLGASQECNEFLIYPRCLAPHYILPVGNPNLVWVQAEPNFVNPAQLVHALKFAIQRFKAQEVK